LCRLLSPECRQKWLAVVDLRETTKVKTDRKLGRTSKYEVKTVLWNPHHVNRHLLVSASQQKLELWNVVAERNTLVHSFKAHSRPVSDVGWSFTDPNLLASCAMDSFINVWDIRETRRAKTYFKAVVAGASLVQWNRLNGNIIASAHDSEIRLWDMRKPSTAWGYITAHMTRIHDIDWSYRDQSQLTTCSHDSSVKFWDTTSTRRPLSVIKTGSQPVWRARNYPAGEGVAMLLVPALHSLDNGVFLWSCSNISSPATIFHGHKAAVVEAQWRKVDSGYQLLTLSRDHTLRVWPISDQLSSTLGAVPMETEGLETEPHSTVEQQSLPSHMELLGTTTTDVQKKSMPISLSPSKSPGPTSHPPSSIVTSTSPTSFHDKSGSPGTGFQPTKAAQKLEHEFSLLNKSIPNVTIESMDATQRSCTVLVEQGEHTVRIRVSFPSHYPNGAAPSFLIDRSTSIDISSQQDLNRSLSDIAHSHVKLNRPCLEPCLRRLSKYIEGLGSHPPQPPPSLQPIPRKPDLDLNYFGQLDDVRIPFPRMTGARFCSNGILVSFTGQAKPFESRQTPRALDMAAYRPRLWSGKGRRSGPYLSSSVPKGSSGSNLMQLALSDQSSASPVVSLADVSQLLPISQDLAQMYW
jgi:WD40 repeat protein